VNNHSGIGDEIIGSEMAEQISDAVIGRSGFANEARVLDHGFVRLVDHMGDDLSVVNSARVSFGAQSTLVRTCGACGGNKQECGHKGWHDKDTLKLASADAGLIKFLMVKRHGTPFEHNSFKFHVKAPLFVVREWQRHRIASYNEMSGRYKVFDSLDFYIPDEYRTQSGKPGDYKMDKWPGNADKIKSLTLRHYEDCYDLYKYQIDQGIAKELARCVLPLAMYTEFYFTVNARSLMNFLSLRNDETAQYEIREYAKVIEELWGSKMPHTHAAFIENGRVAP
jgi:thymidylate synthase (FAD)